MQESRWLGREAMSDDERRHMLAHDLGVPFVVFDRHDIDPDALSLIPEPLSRAHGIVAFAFKDDGALPAGRQVEVAMLDLAALEALEPLRPRLPKLLPRLAAESSIKSALVRYQQLLKEKFGQALGEVRHPARLLRGLVSHALAAGADAIHLDPGPAQLAVRYRIGGHLYDGLVLPKEAHASLAGAVPSSGAGVLELGYGDAASVRVFAAPGVHGAKLVIGTSRVPAQATTLESLGLHGEALEALYRALSRRRGLIAITGPAGKTTLLDSLVSVVDTMHAAVARAHDAAGLRAALKADPDIVVMDDIPDRECARLLAAAAKRGVFCLASAAEDIASEIEPSFLIKAAVLRRLCTRQFHDARRLSRPEGEALEAHTSFAPVFNALKDEQKIPAERPWRDVLFAHPVPCGECGDGYKGQVGVYEVAGGAEVIGLTLVEDALFKAAEGTTSIEEVLTLA